MTLDRRGRPAATSPLELAEAAQVLFLENGFEATSVRDIAARVGVSERTFFRYFPTKADVLWVETPAELRRFRDSLAAATPDEPFADVIVGSVLTALRFPPERHDWALHRAQLILTVPAVQTNATARFADWRRAASTFTATRTGQPEDALFPIAVGHAVLAGSLTAHQYWITHPGSDLFVALHDAVRLLLPALPG